jgi:thiol-disulfide isomerase/thioredoxin
VSRPRAIALIAAIAVISAAAGAAYHAWSVRAQAERDAASHAAADRILAARYADLQGGTPTLEQWRGRVLVVNFWATWCAPCREEIPAFVRLQERHGSRGLQFVGIAFDQPDKVAEFAREFRVNYPLVLGGLDTMELMRQAGNRAGVLPYTLVIDRQGRVVSREPGGVKEGKLEDLVRPLL